jgi:hypothetical protein
MTKNGISTLVVVVGMTLLSGFPALAQNKYAFKVPTSFYAGNTKMPAGTYTLTRMEDDQSLFTLQNSSGSHSVILESRQSSKTSTKGNEILFNRYNNTDYLEAVETNTGNSIDILPSAAERLAAKKATAQPHSVPAM